MGESSRDITGLGAFVAALFFCAASVCAQGEEGRGPISTDRPSASTAPGVVPRVALQFEMGYDFSHSESQEVGIDTRSFPGLLVRFGAFETLEARLTVNGWSFTDAATGDESGFNDMGVGAKWAIVSNESESGLRPQVSLLAEVNLPVGDPEFTNDFANPKFLGLFKNRLSEQISLTYNFGLNIIRLEDEVSGERTVYDLPYTVMLSGSLDKRWAWFAELFGAIAVVDRENLHSIQGGATFLLTDVFQLDVKVGAGLVDNVSIWLVGAGLGFRLFH